MLASFEITEMGMGDNTSKTTILSVIWLEHRVLTFSKSFGFMAELCSRDMAVGL